MKYFNIKRIIQNCLDCKLNICLKKNCKVIKNKYITLLELKNCYYPIE